MSQITRSYTFTDSTTAYGSQVETEVANVVTTWNNHDSASSSWTNMKIAGTVQLAAGAQSAPVLTYSSDTSTGIYFPAGSIMSVTAGGTEQVRFNTGVFEIRHGVIQNLDGTAGTPTYAFAAGTTMGMYRSSTSLGFSTAGTQRFIFDGQGNAVLGTAALGTTATDGFLYIDSCAGTPTGVPTTYTGRIPMIFDATNSKIYFYNSGWKGVTVS